MSDKRIERLTAVLRECRSLDEAANRLGTTSGAIRGVLRRDGLKASDFLKPKSWADVDVPIEWEGEDPQAGSDAPGAFDRYLAEQMKSPTFAAEFVKAEAEIRAVDKAVNEGRVVPVTRVEIVEQPPADRTFIDRVATPGPHKAKPVIVDRGELERVLCVPDSHHPFSDELASDLVVQVANAWRPHRIVILGDWIDAVTVSAHDRDPRRMTQLQDEVAVANEWLDRLDAVPGVQSKIFCEGNHEYRLARYLMRQAPALLDSLNVPALLRLPERGYDFVEYRNHIRINKLYATHEAGHAGVHAVHHTAAAYESSVIFGHTHRLAVTYTGSITGDRHVGCTAGWLGDASEAKYLSESQKRAWQLGFATASFEPSGIVHLAAHPIVDYGCVVDGRLYERRRLVAA